MNDGEVIGVIDATHCPLCGEANRCAVELARETGTLQSECWCMQADFSAALLSKVPDAARGASCICARCAAATPR
jgi:hypothetical protein